ncbi:MAG TPA: AsmA-like C-terminal domain-containing protein [Rhizomicrobium sp.]|nr:AsmA-like C-terminal domain-containing protein [Rhizomicrobium sp.]
MRLPFARFIKAHHVSHAVLVMSALVAAIVFFVVGAGLRLLWGPVSLGPLRGTLAGAIHDALPGIALDYDQAAIEWSRDQGRVNLVVLGARLYDSHGKVVASAPKAAIDLAAAPFLSGQVVVKRITLVGVKFTLVHMKNGRVRLGNEKDEGDNELISRLSDVINARGNASSSLDTFAVRDANLGLFDEITGLYVTAPHAQLVLRSQGKTIGTSFDADVMISGRKSHVTAKLTLPPEKGPIGASVSVTSLDLRALSTNSHFFDGIRNMPVMISASADFRVDAGARLGYAAFDITAHGEIPWAAMADKAVHVSSLRLVGRYDGESGHLALTTADLNAREVHAALKGGGQFFYGADGKLEHVHADLSAKNIAVDMPGILPKPTGYQTATLQGDYLTGPRQFAITKFDVTASGFALDAAGTLTLNDNGAPGLVAKAHIPAMPVRQLLLYWPTNAASGARNWIDANIFAGDIGPLDAEVNFPPGMLDQDILPEESLKLTFAMRNLEGNYVRGLTHATQVMGDAILTGDTFRANFTGGRIGPLMVSRGTALIPNLHLRGTVGQFGVQVDGAMPDIMTLIDMKPLGYATRFGIDPRQTGGTASADLAFQVPMLADLPVDAVGISVKAQVNQFAVTLGGKTRLTDGAVIFEIDNNHLHQTGALNLADSRLNVDWTEDFKTADPVTTRLQVKGNMTEAGRAALNINLLRFFRGTVPITADMTGHRGNLLHADVNVDFTPATLSVPIVNLEKSPGQAASGRIGVNFGPANALQDETIHISGPVLNLNGTADFGKNGDLTVLNLPSLKMGALNDLSFQLSRGPNGDDYLLRGHSLDGSKIGRTGSNEQPGGTQAAAQADDTPEGRLHIDAKLDRLAMRSGVAIAPFNLDLGLVGNRPSVLNLSGNIVLGTKSAAIAANLETSAAGRKVALTSGDAGLLARGIFAFESMRGGQLSATVNLPGQATDPVNSNSTAPDFTGVMTIKNFQLLNQPLLSRMFAAGSLTGIGDLMGGDGISLEEWNFPFTSKNNVLSVNGARAVGRAIGASADGYIDRPHGTLALKGSLIPAYELNSILSNIPLLGDILASKQGEGIFGVTYSATGNMEQPNISTNPLSMLTPGILRRIFEGHIPTKNDAPTNNPTPRPNPGPAQAQATAPKPTAN